MRFTRRLWLGLSGMLSLQWLSGQRALADDAALVEQPFGADFPNLDSLATGKWWTKSAKGQNPPPSMNVAREDVIAFAVYTHDRNVLKMTAQLFPLKLDEPRDVRLEIFRDDAWHEAARVTITMPGWSAHFRIEQWDSSKDVRYRVRHGEAAMFEGLVRRDPVDKDQIVVANMSCNSSRTTGLRPEIIDNLKAQNPDLLFFAGDQTYRHTEHTAGWIEFGLQFRDILRDRPTITIPDDHDVGHPNLWGENGKQSTLSGNADGGYFYPVDYVNMVQRQQTWHLPDAIDPAPVERGITVYFTRLRLGGIDFAILEDRKFKSGPAGKIPQMGPRPDHINDPSYDPASIDVPGLELLGDRQMKFLEEWTQDWTGADIKAVLSQTAFCGAVHMHGGANDRLLADLDCNGWPQSGRNAALRLLRKAKAVHLCGDQHLAVVVKHGIEEFGDGPYAFTSPALVNTIYGRWWHPENEQPGPNPVPDSPLPWTGDFKDGLGNRISMMAYANPDNIRDEKQRADGYGLVRFDRKTRQITFECWPRFSDATEGDKAQFPGWPVTISVDQNDGRKPVGWLPMLHFEDMINPVVQVIDQSSQEVVYATRIEGSSFRAPVYSSGPFNVRAGTDRPDRVSWTDLKPQMDTTVQTVAQQLPRSGAPALEHTARRLPPAPLSRFDQLEVQNTLLMLTQNPMNPTHPVHASKDPRRNFAIDVVKTLRAAGFEALWAGGCVRDALLGKVPKDYDVASTATPDEVIRLFGPRRTVAVGASFGVVMVLGPVKSAGQIEVATFRADGEYLDGRRPTSVTFCRPEEDARRRDFTINGLFFDPITEQVIDYVGGQDDLKRQLVRAIGDPHARFAEDKLRMLRAVRFAATFSFAIDPATADAIRAHHTQLSQVSVERIAQELRRMLAHPSRALSIRMLQETLLLSEVLPEICDTDGNLADSLAESVLDALEVPHSDSALAVLLRGLYELAATDFKLRRAPIEETCRRLKLSNEELEGIVWLIESLPTMTDISARPLHVRKMLLADPRVDLLLDVSRAIAIAQGRDPADAEFCRNYLTATPREVIAPTPFVNGRDVMTLGVPAGPEIRELLSKLWAEQLDELISDRTQALQRLQELVTRKD